MKCRKVKKGIVNYADLDEPQRKRLDEHLNSCPECLSEFRLHQNSLNIVKEVINFEEPDDFWQDYQVDVRRKIPSPPLWRRFWEKMDSLAGLIKTPLVGPFPAYVFSFVLLLVLALGLYPTLSPSKRAESFDSNLVVYQGDLISVVDDGGVTIYAVGNR